MTVNAKRSNYFDLPLPRILAHRGFARDAPENTLLAIASALAAGATYVETDVYASRDGIAVLSHDADLSRLVGRVTHVSDLSLAELERVDLGAGQTFCSLASALDAFPTTRFNIDIKSAAAAAPAARAIADSNATPRVLVTSFSERRRRATIRLLPGVATSASAVLVALAIASAFLGLITVSGAILRGVGAVQVPESSMLGPVKLRIVTPRFIAHMHRIGVEVHVWTINDPGDMRRLLDTGVDGLITDRVDIALRATG